MNKKRISVQIEGRNYALITSDDEKYVQAVAAEVVEHIRKTAQNSKQLDTRDCAVLAALDFCDDRNKAFKKNKDFVDKADKIIQQTNDLNKACKEYKEKLTEAINENTRLTKKYKELEKQFTVLKFENEQLKKKTAQKVEEKSKQDKPLKVLNDDKSKTEEELKNEKLLGYVPMRQYSLFDDDKNE